MNVLPDSSKVNYFNDRFVSLLTVIAPLVGAIFSRVFIKPADEERRLSRLKIQLLSVLRLKISTEVAEIIPPKTTDINNDDYLSICRERLNDYFSRRETVVRDLLTCERVFKSSITAIRFLKYAMISAPCVGMAYLLFIFFWVGKEIHAWIHLLVSVCLLGAVIIALFIVERKKDKVHDLCAKYEVTDEKS